MHILKTIGFAELVEFCCRGPPIVMVTLKDNFPAGNFVNEGKIRLRFLKIQRPGEISEEHRCIVLANIGQAFLQFIHVTNPGAAKYIHWLRRTKA